MNRKYAHLGTQGFDSEKMTTFVKNTLKRLEVSYTDECCNETFIGTASCCNEVPEPEIQPVIFHNDAAFVGSELDTDVFADWPYNSAFTQSVLGAYGTTPYIDILVNPLSTFGIGGIAWRSINPSYPYMNAARMGDNCYAAIEANAFTTGSPTPYTSTIEFYLGTLVTEALKTPLTIGNTGNHFYGNRTDVTVDAHYRLFVGNKVATGSSNFSFGSVDATFAADANNKPFVFFNYPTKTPMAQTDKILIMNNTSQMYQVTLSDLKAALALAP